MASHGYVVIDIDADRIRSEWWHVDTVLERTSGVSLAAAFETPRGARQLHRPLLTTRRPFDTLKGNGYPAIDNR